MLAKVIAYAPTRTEAALTLANSLRQAQIHGVGTNRDLLVGILTEPEFLAGGTDTAYLDRHPVEGLSASPSEEDVQLAAAAGALALREHHRRDAPVQPAITAGWRNVRSQPALVSFATSGGTQVDVRYRLHDDHAQVTVDETALDLTVRVEPATGDSYDVTLEANGLRRTLAVAITGASVDVDGPFGGVELTVIDPLPLPGSMAAAGSLAAPMPGSVVRIEVEPGTAVVAGQPVVILEAMKMEHSVRAPHDGIVESILVGVGDQVDVGEILAVVVDEGTES
jgi:acetyl/propionyl-CoA carboxylase alpha subunit